MAPSRSWARSWTSSSSAPDRTRSQAASQGRRITPELPPLIVIAGATATGKTALSLALHERLAGAAIVAADSRQVYRGMDIGTAKPTAAELARAPHACLDLVEPDEPFTAADYVRAARRALADIAGRDGMAILAGGTGLYLRAIARGLPLDGPDADPAVRAELEARLDREGLGVLGAELQARDPEAAGRIDLHNPRRVVRALERAIVTGTAMPPQPQGYPAPVAWLGLELPPAEHRAAIAGRAAAQFEAGLLEEAAALRERFGEDRPAFSAMGYREAFDVLDGRADLGTAVATDARRTWQYARRQRTWFRSEPDVRWLAPGEGTVDGALAVLSPFLERIGRADYARAR